MLVNTIFYERVDELFATLDRATKVLEAAETPYEVVGGLAVFLQVREVDEENARLTNDVDILINRKDLPRIAAVAPRFGLEHRHAAGIDMLVDSEKQKARGGIYFIFANEKVRPDYHEAAPNIEPAVKLNAAWVAPIKHLLRMKLTSSRLKDQTHVRDMLNVGLITPEAEEGLSPELVERLDYIKAHE